MYSEMNKNVDADETLRELCSIGDVELIKKFIDQYKPNVNSQNKVNGWTALHWAVKRNHVELVNYLLNCGASNDILNSDGRKPSFYAKETQLKRILNDETEVFDEPAEKKFIPSYLKTPQFHYSSSYGLIDPNRHKNTEKANDNSNPSSALRSQSEATSKSHITLKLRVHSDVDFIEFDVDTTTLSFTSFKQLCATELQIDAENIEKIRKLPNVLIRNDNDIRRLKTDQEIEICIK